MAEKVDIAIVGAGIAGAALAYFLDPSASVALIEREERPGYHSSGRSAAMHTETYGNATIRALTCASRGFFEHPPAGFSAVPPMSPRGVLIVGRADQRAALEKAHTEGAAACPSVRRLGRDEALGLCPVLRPDYVAGAVLEPEAGDLDVDALHRGYLGGAKAKGARLVCDAELRALERSGPGWRLVTGGGDYEAAIVVLAAGAWCDEIATLAGAGPIGLAPKRRTAFLFAGPDGIDASAWPMVEDAEEAFYFKPQSGLLLGSPADESPSPPCDAQADELDLAIGADRIMQATRLEIRRFAHKWAGLRSFAPDRTPVVGFEPAVPGLFWLAGQGGYGIMTSPALGRLAAALVAGGDVPDDLAARGVRADTLSPARFRG